MVLIDRRVKLKINVILVNQLEFKFRSEKIFQAVNSVVRLKYILDNVDDFNQCLLSSLLSF